ncbi:fungal-specific transcription factor domain-containing protein [Xylariales sp. AK1849]|nr:fungal-specific transcription factor domain-containing protein [Xylariales sp. AK1849]
MATSNCHNCRKRRLRCDRSVPTCNKCATSSQECLGYGKIYQWTDAVASRGRLAGKKTFSPSNRSGCNNPDYPRKQALVRCESGIVAHFIETRLPSTLVDPLFQPMDGSSRFYLSYFSGRICQELVVHDSLQPVGNPFRQLIAMSTRYPFLQHILVAASAMHFSNVIRRSAPCGEASPKVAVDAIVDALRARHKAIRGLQAVLDRQKLLGDDGNNSDEKDALLATILFFINFALIDSGKGGWRVHMKAARRLIAAQASNLSVVARPTTDELSSRNTLASSPDFPTEPAFSIEPSTQPTTTSSTLDSVSIRDYVASDAVVYYIWGSALDCLPNAQPDRAPTTGFDMAAVSRILNRTEANSYHSCPAQLLVLLLRTAHLSRDVSSKGSSSSEFQDLDSFADLLREAQNFDVDGWAAKISAVNSHVPLGDELEVRLRTHVAATYRAVVCLYVLLVAPKVRHHIETKAMKTKTSSDSPYLPNTEDLVSTVLAHLSRIPNSSTFFKYTSWPVFLAGVETADPEHRAWVLERLHAIWEQCPWGMMKSAMEALPDIWQLRDRSTPNEVQLVEGVEDGDIIDATRSSWSIQLRSLGTDFLIV